MCNLLGEEGGTNATSREMKIQHEKRGGGGGFSTPIRGQRAFDNPFLFPNAKAKVKVLYYAILSSRSANDASLVYFVGSVKQGVCFGRACY